MGFRQLHIDKEFIGSSILTSTRVGHTRIEVSADWFPGSPSNVSPAKRRQKINRHIGEHALLGRALHWHFQQFGGAAHGDEYRNLDTAYDTYGWPFYCVESYSTFRRHPVVHNKRISSSGPILPLGGNAPFAHYSNRIDVLPTFIRPLGLGLNYMIYIIFAALLRGAYSLAQRYYRLRKKGICITCGYDLAGLTNSICPECGNDIPA